MSSIHGSESVDHDDRKDSGREESKAGGAAASGGHSEDDDDDDEDDDRSSQISRDTIVNPFWIEDKKLGRGPVDYLSGSEVTFWKDLIEKYLHPLEVNKVQQVSSGYEKARPIKGPNCG